MKRTRRSSRGRVRLRLEALESRWLLDTGLARFASAAELQQYLVDTAAQQWRAQFGVQWSNVPVAFDGSAAPGQVAAASGTSTDFSQTNVQVPGVDEGDLVKTDGNYLYLLSGDELDIVRAQPGNGLALAAHTPVEGRPITEYLSGSHVTVISGVGGPADTLPPGVQTAALMPVRGSSRLKVTVFDVSNAASPQVVKATYLDGTYVDSRAVGDQVYLVVQNSLGGALIPQIKTTGTTSRYETEAEFRARLAGGAFDAALPHLYTRPGGPDSPLVAGPLLGQATDTYKPLTPGDTNLVSVVTLDAGSATADPASVVTAVGSYAANVYASADHLYLVLPHWTTTGASTDLEQFTPNGSQLTLTAAGTVNGQVLNQFALDEQGAFLRVATTTGLGPDASNNVYVLTADQGALTVVGSLEHLAPGERLFAARFDGDRGYLVTFQQTDPLFALDLHDPAHPQVAGELQLPGFSRYLQPIDATHLLGVGRDADPATGRTLDLQVSLYDVSDLGTPQLVSRYTIDPGNWSWSEGEFDHHAIGYYPEAHVLALPVTGYDSATWDYRSQLWVLQVDPAAGFQLLGKVTDDTPVRRSVRVGDNLYSISHDAVKVQPLLSPGTPTGTVALQDPLLTAQGTDVTAQEGVAFNGPVTTFQLGRPDGVTATINWGDGGFSPGMVQPDGAGGFQVVGSHVFDTAGTHDVAVSLTRGGDTQTVVHSTADVSGDVTHHFVVQLYRDLLHRDPDAAGLEAWNQALEHGASRADVVRGFEGSREYRANVVQQVYGDLLGRQAEAFGLNVWVQFLAGGGTEEQLRARVLGSEEYFARNGNGTSTGFLQALYHDVLHRDLDPTGAAAWGQALAHGRTRNEVALAVLQSAEARTNTVQRWYHDYLGRAADDSGLQVFVGALQRGFAGPDVVVSMLASDEYFGRT
jgi:uncharacterized secreted protein with C-terminal beta-propeller domain